MYNAQREDFRKECRVFLNSFSLQSLRAFGRGIGVRQVTIYKKRELVEEAIRLMLGETMQHFGRVGKRAKNNLYDPLLEAGLKKLVDKYEIDWSIFPRNVEQEVLSKEERQQIVENVQIVVNFSDLDENGREKLKEFLKSI